MQKALRLFVVAAVVVTLSVGMAALAKKPGGPPGGGGCPSPAPGCFCITLYAPVVCGPDGCSYSNQCFAGCAGWKKNECTPTGPGPVPF